MSRRRQRGVALITAIVLVALATVLAVAIGFNTALTARRGAGSAAVEQGFEFAQGAEALAAYVLLEDLRNGGSSGGTGGTGGTGGPAPPNQSDTPSDAWTQPYGPVEIAPQVALEAQLEDEQGKFNLNTLLGPDGKADEDAVLVFRHLLRLLDIETRLADLMVDWLDDGDGGEARNGGGEDSLYTAQRPAFRTANGLITSPSELMQLPGLTREQYLRLLPYVTALPPEGLRKINVCFAKPALLDAIVSAFAGDDHQEYTLQSPEQFAQTRAAGCFPTASVLAQAVSDATRKQKLEAMLGTQSQYFRLRTWVTIGATRFTLYSLLQRTSGQSAAVTTLLRSFGTE